jgi:hypothetical protein
VGKSAALWKLYCEWNEIVGRNFWVSELTSFGMHRFGAKKPAPEGAGFQAFDDFTLYSCPLLQGALMNSFSKVYQLFREVFFGAPK